MFISIPAPARGRTFGLEPYTRATINFNSRPREGANQGGVWDTAQQQNFNSRPREGANVRPRHKHHPDLHFNSRPREGANLCRHPTNRKTKISIPAPARGRTPRRKRVPTKHHHFNSRPREGANNGTPSAGGLPSNFNSRPREGANLSWRTSNLVHGISIPAPARGRTWPLCWAVWGCYFNSRPREGANLLTNSRISTMIYFNSRPREGANCACFR